MTNARPRCRIDFTDDLMVLLDAEGHGLDACRVDANHANAAEHRIDDWARSHKLDADAAKRELRQLVRAMR